MNLVAVTQNMMLKNLNLRFVALYNVQPQYA